jgi:ribosomal protein S3AE
MIYPGHIFTAPHLDIDTGRIVSHIFVCIYNQALDLTLPETCKNNIKGVIVSSVKNEGHYIVPLVKRIYPYLSKDSFCYADKEYTFLSETVTVIGSLSLLDLSDLIEARDKIQFSENHQLRRSLENTINKEGKRYKEHVERIKKGV